MSYTEKVHENVSDLKRPLLMVKEMMHDLRRASGLAKILALRDIKAKYRQTLLGFFWVVLPPLAATLAFVILQRQSILSPGVEGVPYPVFAMVGVVFWQLFAESIMTPLQVVQSSKSMLAKIYFPRESLLLAALLQVSVNFFVKFILLILILYCFGLKPQTSIILVPVAVVSIMMLGSLIGIVLIPVGLLYQDIILSIGIILMLLMFVTPVGFEAPDSGIIASINQFNPVTPLLECARDWVLSGWYSNFAGLIQVASVTFVALIFGWVLYRISFPVAIERMGS